MFYSVIALNSKSEKVVVREGLTHSKAVAEVNRGNYRVANGTEENVVTYMVRPE